MEGVIKADATHNTSVAIHYNFYCKSYNYVAYNSVILRISMSYDCVKKLFQREDFMIFEFNLVKNPKISCGNWQIHN